MSLLLFFLFSLLLLLIVVHLLLSSGGSLKPSPLSPLILRLNSYRRRLLDGFERSTLGSRLRSHFLEHLDLFSTLCIYLSLGIICYQEKTTFVQVIAFAILHLFIIRKLNFNLKPLEDRPAETLQEVYYGSAMLMYIVFFILISFFFCGLLLLFPTNGGTTTLFALSFKRLRIGSYIFGLLMLASIRSIQEATPLPHVPGFYPEPRFIGKAMYVALHQSFVYRHRYFMFSIGVSMIAIQVFGTIFRFMGYRSWGIASPFPLIGIFITLCFLFLAIHSLITYLIFLRRMERRYGVKYKTQDDLAEKNKAIK